MSDQKILGSLIKDASTKLGPNQEEYQRLEYCLKLNLRLIGGRLKDLKIYQINQSTISFQERFMDKTTIETMDMVTSAKVDDYEALTKQRGRLNITPAKPRLFTYGTIIEDPEQLSSEGEYTFCVFRVGIGKSFCHKKEADEGFENIPLREGYDSTYLENSHSSKVFKMDYIIYSSDNVLLTHVIKCKIDVREYQASHSE